MNSHLLSPKIGLRFLLTGTPYEVSWTSQGVVRYSAIAGGKIYSISIEKFTEKYHSGEITLNGDLSDSLLSMEKTRGLLRKQEYIKTVLNSVSHHYSHSNVYKTIMDVSKRIKDHSPPSSRSVMRWIKLYLDNDKDLYALNKFKVGNTFLRFNIEIEQIGKLYSDKIANSFSGIHFSKNIMYAILIVPFMILIQVGVLKNYFDKKYEL